MARHRELAPAAEREAVHRGERRLGRRARTGGTSRWPRSARALPSVAVWSASSRDVGARDEGAPGAGEQHGADVVALARASSIATPSSAHQGVVQRVQLVGPIDGDRRDPVGDLEGQKLVGHCGSAGAAAQVSYIPGPRFALAPRHDRLDPPRGLEVPVSAIAGATGASCATRARSSASACSPSRPAWTRRAHRARARAPRCRRGDSTRRGGSSTATTRAPWSADSSASTTGCASWRRTCPSCAQRIRRHAAARDAVDARRRRGRRAARERELLPHRQRALRRGEPHVRHRDAAQAARRDRRRRRASSSYVGKRSIRQRQVVANRELARLVARHLDSPGARLFRYQDEAARWRNLTARDVNAYLHDTLGVPFSAKDFRTWGGTLRAATVLAELGPARSRDRGQAQRGDGDAARRGGAGQHAGDLPQVVRASDRRRAVPRRWRDHPAPRALPRRTRESYAHSPEERALIRFLDEHFPERRSERDAKD